MHIMLATYKKIKNILRFVALTLIISLFFAPKTFALASIGVSPNGGSPLSEIVVSGQGYCSSCGQVIISMSNEVLGYSQPDAGGRFNVSVNIPGTLRPGINTIFARQDTQSGSTISAQTQFYVAIYNYPDKETPQTSPTTYPNQTTQTNPKTKTSPTNNSVQNSVLSENFVSRHNGFALFLFGFLLASLAGLLWWRRRFNGLPSKASSTKKFK